MGEMRQSLYIMKYCLINMPGGYSNINDNKNVFSSKIDFKRSMENMIHHFKYFTEGFNVNFGVNYCAVEAPKGEFGVFLISNNTNKPVRCHLRSPAYFHLQGLSSMVKGHMIADLVTVIGTLDVVFGEIDR
jgi:NADH:ubiquinone oxidoreductase subunit D